MPLTLPDLARQHGGREDDDYAFEFDDFSAALPVIHALGASPRVPDNIATRPIRLRPGKRNQLVLEVGAKSGDDFPGALLRRKVWRLFLGVECDQRPHADQLAEVDHRLRCLSAETEGGPTHVGMYMFLDGRWTRLPDRSEIWCIFRADNVPAAEIDRLKGIAAKNAWRHVHRPFAPEFFPETRQWNLGAPQLTYSPVAGPHPHWDAVLRHCGADLDTAWPAGGANYLLLWAANLVRHPAGRLPYLFLHGEQNSGKSILHEALALLMTKGVVSADRALLSEHNGELAHAVLAYIEEKDVSKNGAYNKLKDWVTGGTIWIRRMYHPPIAQPNTLHFIQCANDRGACPCEFGDSRIIAIHVAPLAREIPKGILLDRLREEAPAMIHTLLTVPLPEPTGRLRLPVIETAGKEAMTLSRVPDFVSAIADLDLPWHGTAKELRELIGHGPKTIRKIKSALDANTPFLRSRGITVDFPPTRSEQGYTLNLRKTA